MGGIRAGGGCEAARAMLGGATQVGVQDRTCKLPPNVQGGMQWTLFQPCNQACKPHQPIQAATLAAQPPKRRTHLLVAGGVRVHLVHAHNQLLHAQQVEQARVLAGLALDLARLAREGWGEGRGLGERSGEAAVGACVHCGGLARVRCTSCGGPQQPRSPPPSSLPPLPTLWSPFWMAVVKLPSAGTMSRHTSAWAAPEIMFLMKSRWPVGGGGWG